MRRNLETPSKRYLCLPQTHCLGKSKENLGEVLERIAGDTAMQWGRINDLVTRIEQIYLPIRKVCLFSITGEILDNAFRYSRKGTKVSVSSRTVFKGTRLDIVNHCSLDDYVDLVGTLSENQLQKEKKGLQAVKDQVAEFGGDLDYFLREGKLRLTVDFPYN